MESETFRDNWMSQGSNSNGDKVFSWLSKLPTHIHIYTSSPHTHTNSPPHFSIPPFNYSEGLLDWHFPHQKDGCSLLKYLLLIIQPLPLSHSFTSNKVGLQVEGHSSTPNAVCFSLYLSIHSPIHPSQIFSATGLGDAFFYFYVSMNTQKVHYPHVLSYMYDIVRK